MSLAEVRAGLAGPALAQGEGLYDIASTDARTGNSYSGKITLLSTGAATWRLTWNDKDAYQVRWGFPHQTTISSEKRTKRRAKGGFCSAIDGAAMSAGVAGGGRAASRYPILPAFAPAFSHTASKSALSRNASSFSRLPVTGSRVESSPSTYPGWHMTR